ncbi:hypothetical protein [Aureimonas leprariae]|uniref:Uncharacterized protein n=1 Tax=Plantimonas leprariae TaxID=2615207 RepID=A0A7V7TV39_9HYPH|nr:hypothetical protein [Aureimonas leprariae]KAB0677165.1 hypothetical protein F6X38_18735 [Aureimonas leprariae]
MPTNSDPRERANNGEPGPERSVPDGKEADFAEKGPAVVDDQAGLSEEEKLEDAVEDLSTEKD